jgi:hypothetical protein
MGIERLPCNRSFDASIVSRKATNTCRIGWCLPRYGGAAEAIRARKAR